MDDVLFSSNKMDWQTPGVVLDAIRDGMGPILLDPCTTDENPVGAQFFISPGPANVVGKLGTDGLREDWWAWDSGGLVFVNPPYGRELPAWVDKGRAEADYGCEILMLVPARTDTKWFQTAMFDAVCFWRGRLKFKGAKNPAPFPSALLYWGEQMERFSEAFQPLGLVMAEEGNE